MSRLAAFLLAGSVLCFAGAGVDPGPTPGFTGLSFRVLNATIPPGGTFQFQLLLTEPKPIGFGSTRPTVPGPVSGIALIDPIGQTAGVAIINDLGARINFNSPLATFGTNPIIDYPILVISMPIAASIPVGTQFPLSIDMANSFWTDPTGQPYPQEIANGKLTIGGTLAISNVVPGGGILPAGTKVSIFGMGFTPDASVSIEGVNLNVGNVQFVSSGQIDVVLPSALQMDGIRVRVNTLTERSMYFSYLRALAVGQSTHALVAQSYPLFSRQTYSGASLAWNRTGQQFTALALQNPGADAVEVTVEMQSVTGETLGAFSLPLPAFSKITRDLTELFSDPPAGAAAVRITPSRPIQILGLLGDNATGDVVPVIPTAP
jgi:hypothetical protein